MKLPCDEGIWNLIPMIKREVVLRLYNNHKISRINIAKKLNITRGSVTQYIQGKRAEDSIKLRRLKPIDKLITMLAKDIVNEDLSEKEIAARFCNICRTAQNKIRS